MNTKIRDLAYTFPTLCNAPGIRPGEWDIDKLDEWASTKASHGEQFAVRFILAVWSGRSFLVNWGKNPTKTKDEEYKYTVTWSWRCGPFDVIDAMGTWDAAHREAFLAWARAPWWP